MKLYSKIYKKNAMASRFHLSWKLHFFTIYNETVTLLEKFVSKINIIDKSFVA